VAERRADNSRVGDKDGPTGRVHDLRAQLHSTFQQLDVILLTAGSSRALVVEVQVFLLRITENLPYIAQYCGTYFEGGLSPRQRLLRLCAFRQIPD
jgi:enamine deaminase RidA (YjgF/YER057c/UK114 family)